jgi:hypothetical protein
VRKFAIMQPVKAAPYTTHAQFSDPATILALPAPLRPRAGRSDVSLRASGRACAQARRRVGAQRRSMRWRASSKPDWKPFVDGACPRRRSCKRRASWLRPLADAQGDLAAAQERTRTRSFIEDALAYIEPPYWYYPCASRSVACAAPGHSTPRSGRSDRSHACATTLGAGGTRGDLQAQGRRCRREATKRAFAKAWLAPAGGPDARTL